MCKCNPNIRSPWCVKCMPINGFKPMDYDGDELIMHPFDKVKEIIKIMQGLSEDDFNKKYLNDTLFHNSVDALAVLSSERIDKPEEVKHCIYCMDGVSMSPKNTDELGIGLHSGFKHLVAYGKDKNGWDISVSAPIEFCPKCGRKL